MKPFNPPDNDDSESINIDKFSDEFINNTLTEKNITKKKEVNCLFKIIIVESTLNCKTIVWYSQAVSKFSRV